MILTKLTYLFLCILFYCLSIICSLNAATRITVIAEDDYAFSLALIGFFNVSYLYYQDYYALEDHIVINYVIVNATTTRTNLIQETEKTDYVISVVRDERLQEDIRFIGVQVDMATMQIDMTKWNGVYPVTMDQQPDFPDYTRIIPGEYVMDNILREFFLLINITDEMTILMDDVHSTQDFWRIPFQELNISVTFLQMPTPTDGNAVKNQLTDLSTRTKTIVLVGDTLWIENYVFNAADFFTQNIFTWIMYSKDILPFKCDLCIAVDMFVIRPLPTGLSEDVRYLSDYLESQEIDEPQYDVSKTDEMDLSTCLGAIKVAFAYLIANNDTIIGLLSPDYQPMFKNMDNNRTLSDILTKTPDLHFEYGPYVHHYQSFYYQDIAAGVFKISRLANQLDDNINKYIGNWTFTQGIIPLYYNLGVNVRELRHYRIVTIIQEPFIQYTTNGSYAEFEGYCIDLMNQIQEELQITYEIYLVPDGKFGSVDSRGSWNGLMGDCTTGKADIILAPMSVMAEREIDVDFTVPYYDLVGMTILMKKSDAGYSLFKFMKVLEWPVWVCIIAAYVLTSFLLWIFDKFSPYSYVNNIEKFKEDPEKRIFTLKESLWFCMTSLTPQGGGEAPKNISGRLVAATWWLFGFIIIASYTANLAAFLTVSRLEQPITSLDDLAKQYKVEYATVKGGATETYFRRMAQIEELIYNTWKAISLNESMSPMSRAKLAVWDYPVSDKYTNMWRYMQESKMPNSLSEAIDRVLNSDTGFAFIGDAMEIEYAVLTNCHLETVGSEFSRKPYAIAVQSGSALKDQISAAILKLLNERKLEILKEKWWTRNPNQAKCPSYDDESNGISINNIGGVFIVILAGIVLSFITLVFEYFYYRHKAAKQPKPTATMRRRSTETTAEVTNSELEDYRNRGIHYTNPAFQF
uniref:PBPe domain-containing protein n=1 Tax=Panagrellus redivivus TaxID=6233 RepID=A0A7E4W6R4_PANRE